MEEKAILFTHMGEYYWEFARFAPHILWKRIFQYGNKDVKFIGLTRKDRFDIYGKHVDELCPLEIEGDGVSLSANCHRLDHLSKEKYEKIIHNFISECKKKFNIIEVVTPRIDNTSFKNKNLYKKDQMIYDYVPREDNKKIVNKYVKTDKKIIVIAPRYRRHTTKRNWPNWQNLYDEIYDKKLYKENTFIICGKSPDYVPDKDNRFLDINNFEQTEHSSLTGILIEVLKKSSLTVGSQSAIPNISLLFKIPVLEWGHEMIAHTRTYNLTNTKIVFLEDAEYKLPVKTIVENMENIIKCQRHKKF